MEILSKLRCFTTSCLSDNNYDSIVSDDCEKLFSNTVDWKEFSLFFDCLVFGKLTDGLILFSECFCVLAVSSVIKFFVCLGFLSSLIWYFFNFFLRSFKNIA
jgi:hypothetical protein